MAYGLYPRASKPIPLGLLPLCFSYSMERCTSPWMYHCRDNFCRRVEQLHQVLLVDPEALPLEWTEYLASGPAPPWGLWLAVPLPRPVSHQNTPNHTAFYHLSSTMNQLSVQPTSVKHEKANNRHTVMLRQEWQLTVA